jgi:hypothetical protein
MPPPVTDSMESPDDPAAGPSGSAASRAEAEERWKRTVASATRPMPPGNPENLAHAPPIWGDTLKMMLAHQINPLTESRDALAVKDPYLAGVELRVA